MIAVDGNLGEAAIAVANEVATAAGTTPENTPGKIHSPKEAAAGRSGGKAGRREAVLPLIGDLYCWVVDTRKVGGDRDRTLVAAVAATALSLAVTGVLVSIEQIPSQGIGGIGTKRRSQHRYPMQLESQTLLSS